MLFQRHFLLSNDMTISIFRLTESNIYTKVMISPLGDYVMINCGDDQDSYLTRFVPSKRFSYVKLALNFRNSFAKTPYFCDRFHSKSSSIDHPRMSFPDTWSSQTNDAFNINICPFNCRLAVQSTVQYQPETRHYLSSSQYKHLHTATNNIQTKDIIHTSMRPRSTHPVSSELNNYQSVPRCDSLRISPVNVASELFQHFAPILSLLHESFSFPTDAHLPVMVEYMDGVLYVFNGFDPSASVCGGSGLIVEAWILECKPELEPSSSLTANQLYDNKFMEKMGSSSILSLSNDQFSFFDYNHIVNSTTTSEGYSCLQGPVHILDAILTESTYSSTDHTSKSLNIVRMEKQPMYSVLRKHRSAAAHLVLYRQYLESHVDTLTLTLTVVPYSSNTRTATTASTGVNLSPGTDAILTPMKETPTKQLDILRSFMDTRNKETEQIRVSYKNDTIVNIAYQVKMSADDHLKSYMRQQIRQKPSSSVDHHIYRIVTDDKVELTAFYSTQSATNTNTTASYYNRTDIKSNNDDGNSNISVTKIKALFPDGDMMTLDLLTQSVILLSSHFNPPNITYSVDDCLCILRTGRLPYDTEPSARVDITSVSVIRCKLPVLLSFLKYMRTPEHARSQCLYEDHSLRRLTEVAVQLSNRFLMQHNLAYNMVVDTPSGDTQRVRSKSDDKENICVDTNVVDDLFGDVEPSDKETINEFLSLQASLMKDPNYRNYISKKAIETCTEYLDKSAIVI